MYYKIAVKSAKLYQYFNFRKIFYLHVLIN